MVRIPRQAIKYALRRIDYVNPANKLVSKYAPPGYRKTLFKLVKASELFLGGKTAYDIYRFMSADDTPGNAIQTKPQYTPRPSYKTRGRFSTGYNRRNTCIPRPRYNRRRSRSRFY